MTSEPAGRSEVRSDGASRVVDPAGGARYAGRLDASELSVAVIASRFNELVVERLVGGAMGELARLGGDPSRTLLAWVPGAYELPLAASVLAAEHDAVVCLGAVIRGETGHYEHVAGTCATGLARVQLDTGRPVVFGVLTTENLDQALERAGGKAGNTGAEAVDTAVEMANLLGLLRRR